MVTAVVISNSWLSFVVAEVLFVIYYNLKRNCRRMTMDERNNNNRNHISVIGSAIPPVVLATLAVFLLPTCLALVPPDNNVIAITHAAGRMGKVLALQLREDAALTYQSLFEVETIQSMAKNGLQVVDKDATEREAEKQAYLPRIRAIVRSQKEAYAVQCDLGGMRMVSGCIAQPMPCDWLETIVIDSDLDADERSEKLQQAFEGCRAAVLCDASHNELVWNEETTESSTDYQNSGFSMVVPAAESRDLSRRLLEEIDATSKSTTLEHVVLRSTMGLAVARAAEAQRMYLAQQPVVPFEGDIDWEALARAMGGEAALAGPRQAERAFRQLAELKPDRKHTILRLGALTDDAGMVPLVFGKDDSILIKTTDDGTKNYRPPILSRADAARVSTFLVRASILNSEEDDDEFSGNLVTVDCAWHPSSGRESVGKEETISRAARQDLRKAIDEAVSGEATVSSP